MTMEVAKMYVSCSCLFLLVIKKKKNWAFPANIHTIPRKVSIF